MADEIETLRKRAIFRSWHRGMREMDLVVGRFADRHVPAMDLPALRAFDALLSLPDPDLFDLYFGHADVPPELRANPMTAFFLNYGK